MDEQVEKIQRYIRPLRFIPFDVGMGLNCKALVAVSKLLTACGYAKIDCPPLLLSLSGLLADAYAVSGKMEVYIYTTGIGVIVFEDDAFPIPNDVIGVEYCEYRRRKHEEVRLFKHKFSSQIKTLIEQIRGSVDKCHRRVSGNDTWENGGISYVMTTSIIVQPDLAPKYQEMPDVWKKNILMMLEPSLAHEEDSLITHISRDGDFDAYDFSLEDFQSPVSRIKSKDCAIYTSWAAVLVLLKDESRSYIDFVKCLEIDLQSMWMYLYCLAADIKDRHQRCHKSLKSLRDMSFMIKRAYSEFLDLNDSSAAIYFKDVRNDLVKTSGIDELYESPPPALRTGM